MHLALLSSMAFALSGFTNFMGLELKPSYGLDVIFSLIETLSLGLTDPFRIIRPEALFLRLFEAGQNLSVLRA